MHKIAVIRDELCKMIIDRAELVEGLLLGMLTGQHVLFIGPPGTAKSMLVNEFGARLSSGRFFSYLMTKFTKPDEIIGPVSLKGLENDEFKRILTGKTADAHFVFLDEIFNSNSSCTNTILTILNERQYHNGNENVKVPLIMMIGAANQLPPELNDELQAFYDRFLFRYEVGYIKDVNNLRSLFDYSGAESTGTMFTVDELRKWQTEAQAVEIPSDIVNRVVSIVIKLRDAGVAISDRRFRESRKVLQAYAYLNGRSQVSIEDLNVLSHVFWIQPNDRKTFNDALFTVKLTVEVQASEILKEAQQIKAKFQTFDDRARRQVLGGEVNIRLTELENRLNDLKSISGMPSPVVTDAIKKVQDIHASIIRDCLALEERLV